MSRRKGELTPAAIDRLWPHQVAIEEQYSVAHFYDILAAKKELGAAPRGHAVAHAGVAYNVSCFATAEAAEAFRKRFGGLPFNPMDRGKGRHWRRWTPSD